MMDIDDILKRNEEDLLIALSLAENIKNTSFKKYINDRIDFLNTYSNIFRLASLNLVIESYFIDLELFLKICNIVGEKKLKRYYKNNAITILEMFPNLKIRDDILQSL